MLFSSRSTTSKSKSAVSAFILLSQRSVATAVQLSAATGG